MIEAGRVFYDGFCGLHVPPPPSDADKSPSLLECAPLDGEAWLCGSAALPASGSGSFGQAKLQLHAGDGEPETVDCRRGGVQAHRGIIRAWLHCF